MAFKPPRPDNCYKCQHKRDVPGDCRISCADPDPNMEGDPWGINHGWFFYPFCFDPIWKARTCQKFIPIKEAAK